MSEPQITQLGNNIYRFVGEVEEHDGKVNYDFKFKVYESPSLSAAEDSVVVNIIRKKLKLNAHHKITIISDESTN